MKINALTADVEAVHNDLGYLTMMESHLTYLRTTDDVKVSAVSEHQGYKFEGDFYGLLDDLRVDKEYHLITLRLNGYENTTDYKGDVSHILIPNFSSVNLLKNIYQTV